jgi:hypothetical protein
LTGYRRVFPSKLKRNSLPQQPSVAPDGSCLNLSDKPFRKPVFGILIYGDQMGQSVGHLDFDKLKERSQEEARSHESE